MPAGASAVGRAIALGNLNLNLKAARESNWNSKPGPPRGCTGSGASATVSGSELCRLNGPSGAGPSNLKCQAHTANWWPAQSHGAPCAQLLLSSRSPRLRAEPLFGHKVLAAQWAFCFLRKPPPGKQTQRIKGGTKSPQVRGSKARHEQQHNTRVRRPPNAIVVEYVAARQLPRCVLHTKLS
jgi:hypothetical protein